MAGKGNFVGANNAFDPPRLALWSAEGALLHTTTLELDSERTQRGWVASNGRYYYKGAPPELNQGVEQVYSIDVETSDIQSVVVPPISWVTTLRPQDGGYLSVNANFDGFVAVSMDFSAVHTASREELETLLNVTNLSTQNYGVLANELCFFYGDDVDTGRLVVFATPLSMDTVAWRFVTEESGGSSRLPHVDPARPNLYVHRNNPRGVYILNIDNGFEGTTVFDLRFTFGVESAYDGVMAVSGEDYNFLWFIDDSTEVRISAFSGGRSLVTEGLRYNRNDKYTLSDEFVATVPNLDLDFQTPRNVVPTSYPAWKPVAFWTRIVNAVVYDPFSEELLLRFAGLEGQQSSNTTQTVVFEGRDFNFGAASLNFMRTLNPIPAGSNSLLSTLVQPVPNYDNSLPDITSALASFSVDSSNSSFLELREVRLYDAAGNLFFTGDGDYLKSINPDNSFAHTADGIELPNGMFSTENVFLYMEGAPYSGGGRIELDVWGTSNGTGMVVDYSVSDFGSEQSINNHRGQGFPIWQAEGTIDLTDTSEAYTEITVESYDGRSRVFDLVVDSGLSSGTLTFELFGGLLWQLDAGQPPTELTGAFANNRDGSGASIVSKGDGIAWVTTPNTIMNGLNYMDIVATDTGSGDQQTVRVFTGGTNTDYR